MGFRHILGEEFPSLRIVGLAEGRDDHSRNYAATKELLAEHPDLVGIYNIGGGSRGTAEALLELKPVPRVVFVGHELTEHTRRYLMQGAMDAVINQDPAQEVIGAMRLLIAHRGQTGAPASVEATRIEVFVRENLP
jgi:LacI family transcriptional regulator